MKSGRMPGLLTAFLPLEESLLPLDAGQVFGRQAPLEIEIGFGMGEYLIKAAQANPQVNFLGFEQCAKRTLKTLRRIQDAALPHVRLMRMDAVWGMQYLFGQKSLQQVHCLFPCPWPKKRHARHRLFSPQVLRLINSRLMDNARLYIVTDHRPYAKWILENLPGTGFAVKAGMIPARFGTKFERKWAEAGQTEFVELTLDKCQHQDVAEARKASMKAHVLDKVDFSRIRLENVWGELTIKFGDLLYDPKAGKAVVDVVVSEDNRAQHIWIIIVPHDKGWCVCPAAGTVVLPTPGAQQAIDMVAEAVRKSCL